MKLPFIAALAATMALAGLAPSEAYAAPGDLYVLDAGLFTIQRVTPGGAASVFAGIKPATQPASDSLRDLAFDASGNLYTITDHFVDVRNAFGTVAVPNGSTIERFTPGGVESVFASSSVLNLAGLAFDASGNLYAADSGGNAIERFTPGGVVSVFASAGLNGPVALAFDASGNLYAANDGDSTIERFTPGGAASVFASAGLSFPTSLAFDASGNLYAANNGNGTIERFTPGGTASVFANLGVVGTPFGLAFDSGGNLYVGNFAGAGIERITPGGAVSVFANLGRGSGPDALAFEPVVGRTAVPEPASLALLAVGAAGLGLARRKRVQSAGGLA